MTNIEYTKIKVSKRRHNRKDFNPDTECTIKNFDNEYNARKWIKRFNKTAKRLNKIGYVKILNQFKTIEYKIVGVKLS